MSSAKTIADILAFAELIDRKSFIGNPFTSQPMYIAACAFLMEAAAHTSLPPSRGSTPSDLPLANAAGLEKAVTDRSCYAMDQRHSAKHTLLATAANQNYQRCYKALKALEMYWAGTRYIVTVLDQKSKGIMDPLLFTSDDIDSDMPSTELAFTTPGWRRSTSHSASMGSTTTPGVFGRLQGLNENKTQKAWSPKIDHSQAIGWSLTGTTNSLNPNLSFLYQSMTGENGVPPSPSINTDSHRYSATPRSPFGTKCTTAKSNKTKSAVPQTLISQHPEMHQRLPKQQPGTTDMPPRMKFSPIPDHPVSTANADLLLGLQSSYPQTSSRNPPISQDTYDEHLPPPGSTAPQSTPSLDYGDPHSNAGACFVENPGLSTPEGATLTTPFHDIMLIESQDVDMSGQPGGFVFPSGDVIPWLEYLPQDVLSYFGEPTFDNPIVVGPGPGPASNDHS